MKQLKNLKSFGQETNESMMPSMPSGKYDFTDAVICITDHEGTSAVGLLGNQNNRVYIDPIIKSGVDVTKFTYRSEKDFVSYDDNGDFELITQGANYTSGSGYVFPILGEGEFLVLNINGPSYEIVNAMELKKLFLR